MLKAALAAATEPGDRAMKRIHHRHLEDGIREVLAASQVMRQTIWQPQANAPDSHDAAEELMRLAASGGSAVRLWLPAVLSLAALLVAVAALVVAWLR